MNMRSRPAAAVTTLLLALLVLAVVTLAAGCSSDVTPGDSSPTTSAASTTSSGGTATTAAPTSSTTPPVTLSQYEKDLADTAGLANELVRYLSDQGMANDDPRAAVIYGLRARTVALFCRKSLAENDLDNARTSMTDVYANVNRGRNVAEGEVAQILETAYAAIESIGDPTGAPEQAAAKLDEFIALLEPMMAEAAALLGTEAGSTTT